MAKKKRDQVFIDGVNSDLADEAIPNTQARYMLNCNILSSAEGNVGVVTNFKGNIRIPVDLPDGENKTIGFGLDEESNCFYYAVWNSLGYNTWYRFDAVSETVSIAIQCIRDTNGSDIFKWKKTDVILHVVIKQNNLLFWALKGHPARKINLLKASQKDDSGYGTVILEEYTRAYKKTADYAPEARYVTNPDIKSNHVYGNLFKFCVVYHYDDGEKSVGSEYSRVPIPDQENTSGTMGVPLTNNLIKVSFLTGGMTVTKIELMMQRTNQDTGGVMDWVSIVVLDKDVLGIDDNSEYEYDFYNDNTYLATSQEDIIMPHLYFPRNPECMEEVGDRLGYANFEEGFPEVKVDIDYDVVYEELFIPNDVVDRLNEPFITVNTLNTWYEPDTWFTKGWKHTTGEVVIGPDVKRGNIFVVNIMNGNLIDSTFSYEATLSDTATTVANALANKFRTHHRMQGDVGGKLGWVDRVQVSSGTARFQFDIWNRAGGQYHTFTWNVNPVNYSTLKNTGNSILTNKLGSANRYGVVYKDEDQMKSLTYGNIEAVYIKPLNELGELKKAIINLSINHKAPSWAKSYEIVRTRNLVQWKFIQILIQSKVVATNIMGETYTDLIIGSFNTYKAVHPNVALNYEFKKGDRVRVQKIWDVATSSWSVPTNVIDYEIMEYKPLTTETVNKDVSVDPANVGIVGVSDPDPNNIGSFISINGNEREITGISSSPVGYTISEPISTNNDGNTAHIYPSFDIINSRGVIRIKENSEYPIDIQSAVKFGLVEVYTPAQTFANETNENYYSIGYSFPITEENGVFLHSGNTQDQTESQPAIVQIAGYDNYVRNRELPISNNVKNPQVIFSSVEDSSFSDFYVSDMSSYGKPSRLDNAVGIVHFGSRIRYSLNYIEDTNINGLSFFRNENRVDYNDQYGDIKRLISGEGRLYIFKYLKYAWVPIYGNLITDNTNTDIISASPKLLPDKAEYFLFTAGVGDNPESAVRYANDIFSVSPNSGYIINIGGNGAVPVSKVFGMDKEIREVIANASKSGARMFGAYDRKNGCYIVNVEGYDVIVFNSTINAENHVIVEIPDVGDWQVLTGPENGSIVLTALGYTYFPNANFSGQDQITYRSGAGETRTDVFDVLSFETATSWRGIALTCVVESGVRTGDAVPSTLEEYDVITGEPTGITKPNISSDPDYISPYEDINLCPIGSEYSQLITIDRSKNVQSIVFDVVSVSPFNIKIFDGSSYGGTLLWESGEDSVSGTFTAPITAAPNTATIFIELSDSNYIGITEFSAKGAYVVSGRFNDLVGLKKLVLDQSSIPVSHNNIFGSLSIDQCVELEEIVVIRHQLSSVNLTPNNNLKIIDLSYGSNLISLVVGNWSIIESLKVHESLFTSFGYNPVMINSVITSMGGLSVSPLLLQYGLNNLSGVVPSESVSGSYNNIISKGAAVIGRNPFLPLNVVLGLETGTPVGSSSINMEFTLSYPLPVNINVLLSGYIENNFGAIVPINRTVMIPSGNTYFPYTYIYTGGVIITYSVEISNVTPNPAGGINIIY